MRTQYVEVKSILQATKTFSIFIEYKYFRQNTNIFNFESVFDKKYV